MRKDVNEIEAGADKTRFITVAGDISQPETGRNFVANTVEAFGRLDVFVSNAGVCQFAEFLEYVSLRTSSGISNNRPGLSPLSSTIPSPLISLARFTLLKPLHDKWL